MSSRVQSLDWLRGDARDDREVLIEVQDGKSGEFRDGRDDQVGQGRRAVLAPVSEQCRSRKAAARSLASPDIRP